MCHKDEKRPERELARRTKEISARCRYIEDRLESPHQGYEPYFSGMVTKLIEDLMTLNRPTIEIIQNPYGDETDFQFGAVDGGIVLPTLAYVKQFKKNYGQKPARNFRIPRRYPDTKWITGLRRSTPELK